jgi:hypothetical protein
MGVNFCNSTGSPDTLPTTKVKKPMQRMTSLFTIECWFKKSGEILEYPIVILKFDLFAYSYLFIGIKFYGLFKVQRYIIYSKAKHLFAKKISTAWASQTIYKEQKNLLQY